MRLLVIFSILSFILFSCRTQNQIIYNYVEDLNDTTSRISLMGKEPVIQVNDLLHVQVYSRSIKPEIDAIYNMPGTQNSGSGQGVYPVGILVDARGNIEYPRIGSIRAAGLKKNELADIIQSKLQGQLEQPTVIVRFMNFRVTVLGEVGTPGVLTIPTEKITLLEALGMAGDITEFGKKKEVKILRENNGTGQLGIIDVTSKQMFQSPFYHLQQNDVVLVEQTRYRVRQTERERISQQLAFGLSIVTSLALLINIFR
jgi:polysaccharide export outer membrane protein